MCPLIPTLMRECVLPYKVPDSDLVIEKGVGVSIPLMGLHSDPQYYPDPDHFDPDRFVGNNFKPNPTYLPFGDGPRICIGESGHYLCTISLLGKRLRSDCYYKIYSLENK